MFKVIEYYSRFQGMRGQLIRLPGWCRVLLFIAAVPGILLISLSILALLVSILALLLLTVPLYRILRFLVGGAGQQPISQSADVFGGFSPVSDAPDLTSPGRKKVEVTIVE